MNLKEPQTLRKRGRYATTPWSTLEKDTSWVITWFIGLSLVHRIPNERNSIFVLWEFSISLFSGQKRKIIVFNFESWIYPINYLLCLYSIHLNSMLPLPLAVTWWMDQRLYNCVVDISRMITDSMKVKRMKNAKKCLILFKNSFGFAQPFQILGEYTTCCLFFYDIIKCVPL